MANLLGAARDDAALILVARSRRSQRERGEALRHLLYLFEQGRSDQADPGGLSFRSAAAVG